MDNKFENAFFAYVCNDLEAASPEYVLEVLRDVCGLSDDDIEYLGFGSLLGE